MYKIFCSSKMKTRGSSVDPGVEHSKPQQSAQKKRDPSGGQSGSPSKKKEEMKEKKEVPAQDRFVAS